MLLAAVTVTTTTTTITITTTTNTVTRWMEENWIIIPNCFDYTRIKEKNKTSKKMEKLRGNLQETAAAAVHDDDDDDDEDEEEEEEGEEGSTPILREQIANRSIGSGR
ncbi:hypothetical protein M0802_002513 [Mischocyttarus mexicanus]|nr:hypothetical protein M0802_002513 [Mischocyttarus mexicanus]